MKRIILFAWLWLPLLLQAQGIELVKHPTAGGYCAEYVTVYNAFTTKPSGGDAAAQNTFVSTIVSGGVFAKLDVMYVTAAPVNTGGEALINWILPGTDDGTVYNAPTFTAYEGFTGDGASTYLGMNNNLAALTNYSLNSATVGIYIRTNVAPETARDAGVKASTPAVGQTQILTTQSSFAYISMNTDGATDSQIGSNDSRGMWIGIRDASNNQDLYRNKVLFTDGADLSNSVPNLEMMFMAYNNLGAASAYSTKQFSLCFVGSALTPAEITIITDAFEVLMDYYGKGVIP